MNNNDNKLLYYYPTLELFKTKLAANQVNDAAINLIQDKGILYTRGTYINLSDILISNDAPTDDQLLWVDMSADGESVSEKIYIGTTEPTDGQLLWINPDTNEIKYNNNGTWTAIGGGVEEAPVDSNGYVRKDGEWAIVDSGILEAPIDGLHYVRKDGEWVTAGNCPITLIAETDTGDNTDVANVVFTVTIDGVPQLVNNGSTIIVGVGKTVKIQCPKVENYFTPASVEFITLAFALYTKTFIYKQIKLGVYILDKNGLFWVTDNWDTSNNANANAIAVITNNVKVLVALTDSGGTKKMASSSSTAIENYCTAIPYETSAIVDYDGKTNTANIIKTVSSADYAAGWADTFTFPDGTKGHLPSLGEFWEVYVNKTAVDAALSKCGGVAMNTSYFHWCSTYRGKNTQDYRTCWIINWPNGGKGFYSLNNDYYVRAFATLSI